MKNLIFISVLLGTAVLSVASTNAKDTVPETVRANYEKCTDKRLLSAVRALACKRLLESPESRELNLGKIHHYQAISYAHLRMLDKAIKHYNEALKHSPKNALIYYNRAVAETKQGNTKAAIRSLDTAILLNPSHYQAIVRRGVLYANLKNFKYALRDYSEALRIKPNYFLAVLNRGNVYLSLNEVKKAFLDFEQAIKLRENSASAHYGQALAWWRSGKMYRALGSLEKVLQIDPNHKSALKFQNIIAKRLLKLKKRKPEPETKPTTEKPESSDI
jgi:tetratricopeptide (TPR) repeat protein